MEETRFVEVRCKLDTFEGVTLQDERTTLYWDGRVRRHSEYGGWSGQFEWHGDEQAYYLHFHKPGLQPLKVPLWFDKVRIAQVLKSAQAQCEEWGRIAELCQTQESLATTQQG